MEGKGEKEELSMGSKKWRKGSKAEKGEKSGKKGSNAEKRGAKRRRGARRRKGKRRAKIQDKKTRNQYFKAINRISSVRVRV